MKQFLSLVVLCGTFAAFANSIFTWNGGASGNWNNAGNWLCDGVAATRYPGQDTTSQDNTDEVQFNGVTATITLTSTTYVKVFKLMNNADITITSDATRRKLFVYAGGMSIIDSSLTLDYVQVLHTKNNSEWGCGNALTFNGDSLLTLTNAVFQNGKVVSDTCYKVRAYNSTFWYRYTNGDIKSFDYYFYDASFSGHHDNTLLQAQESSCVTFAGTTPSMTLYKQKCLVPGTLTIKYVLPSNPYATAPIRSNQAVDFDNLSGKVKIEIDSDSPALTSGALKTYRLFKWDTSLENGIVLDNFLLPTLRTKDEVFTNSWKSGASQTVPPQYLDVKIDGAYDPDNAPMEATFNTPASFRPEMRFSGNISAMGVKGGTAATSADLILQYGPDNTLGTEVNLGTIAAAGDFVKSYSGFDATSTYYYRLILTNDIGQAVTSAVGTCSHICGTQLSNDISASMIDGRGTVTGSVYVIGAGVTTVKLMLGRNELEMFECGSKVVDSVGQFTIDVIYPDEGKWYYKFTSENTYGSQHWQWATDSKFLTVTDSNTYTWKGGDGDFLDKAKWVCGVENSGIGFPTSASSVVFPSNTTAVVQLTNSVSVAFVKFAQDDSDYTFVGNGSTLGMTTSSSGGNNARLVLDNVKFIDPAYIWSGLATAEFGNDCEVMMLNGAKMSFKYVRINGTNTVVSVGNDSHLEVSMGGLYKAGDAVVLSNGLFSLGNSYTMTGRTITFIGESPRVDFLRNSCGGVTFALEIPASSYSSVPISGATTDFADDGVTTIDILKSSPARRVGGTYRLISWGLASESVKTPNGINTNNVVITGLKAGDSYSWSWEPGASYAAKGPQYLDVTIAKSSGLVIYLR